MSVEIPPFYGRKDGRESAKEHVEIIRFLTNEKGYGNTEQAELSCRVYFRMSLRDEALNWYYEIDESTKDSWEMLRDAFVKEFTIKRNPIDVFTITNQIMSLRQGQKTITEYLSDADHLYKRCPEEMKPHIGRFLVGGLTEENKLDLVQTYLPDLELFGYDDAKRAIMRTYSRIGRENPFDEWKNKKAEPTVLTASDPTTTDTSRELLGLVRLMAQQSLEKGQPSKPPPEPVRGFFPPPPPYQPPRRGPQASDEVICHNCMGAGHFSNSCPAPQVSWQQKNENRARITQQQQRQQQQQQQQTQQNVDPNMASDPKNLHHRPQPAAAAVAQKYRMSEGNEQWEPPYGRGTYGPPGWYGRQDARSDQDRTFTAMPAILTQQNRQMYEPFPLGPVMPATRNSTRNTRRKMPTVVDRPPAGANYRIAKRREPNQSVRQVGGASNSPQPMEVEETGEPPEQAQPQQTATEDGRASASGPTNAPPPTEQQQQAASAPAPAAPIPASVQPTVPTVVDTVPMRMPQTRNQRTADAMEEQVEQQVVRLPNKGPRETIPINLAKGKDRFSIDAFLHETMITIPVYQFLDRSPQARAQVARALQSSQPTRRGRKKAVVASAALEAPTIMAEAFEDDKPTTCLYVTAWIGDEPIHRTLVDTGAVVELVSPHLVRRLPNIKVHEMNEEWFVRLANDSTATIREYVWLPVNVAGVLAQVKAFLIGGNETFELLLSKKWMYRVRAVENHGAGTLSIQGTNGHQRTVTAAVGEESPITELITGDQLEEFDGEMAEEELACLNEELDGYDYWVDEQGKARRQ
ncbi:MAG: hypothetical protein M1838_001183 [Thelocarpon superellum]|nr:MAG: hypothetical protein M1838_001183 [Thelocarpon superellum]